jgi:predicted MFS family arabinose efflux permease
VRPLRFALLAAAAGLALADAAIVTLALPELLVELDTTVEGVAAVIAVYTLALALVPLPVERLARGRDARAVAAAGFAVFTAGSLACALAGSLEVLLLARAVQGAGGAAGMIAAFPLLRGGEPAGRRWWVAAAVIATAIGPALGGALTEAFDWRAIFVVQLPVSALAVLAALTSPACRVAAQAPRWEARHLRPAAGLALLSAALTAVLFLLVLLLVAGFAIAPLQAALVVTVTPVAAVAGALVRGDARWRAAAGAALVGGGTLALGFLPGDRLAWTVPAQVLAGLGLGMALTAIAGPLLPERTVADAARLLAVRHLGIGAAFVLLAPLVANDLEQATERAQLRGVALVLDAPLDPLDKLQLAPALLGAVEGDRPRAGLEEATARERRAFEGEDRATFDAIARRADEVLVHGVGEAFQSAFLITGGLGLLAALVLLPSGGRRRPAGAAAAVALAATLVYVAAERRLAHEPVTLQDPCEPRDLPSTGGIGGFLQDRALEQLDRAACEDGATREELVLALFDSAAAARYEREHGRDPRGMGGLLDLLGG